MGFPSSGEAGDSPAMTTLGLQPGRRAQRDSLVECSSPPGGENPSLHALSGAGLQTRAPRGLVSRGCLCDGQAWDSSLAACPGAQSGNN